MLLNERKEIIEILTKFLDKDEIDKLKKCKNDPTFIKKIDRISSSKKSSLIFTPGIGVFDDIFDSFAIYRLAKGFLGGVFGVFFSLGNLSQIANSPLDDSNFKTKFSKKNTQLDRKLCLLVKPVDKKLKRFTCGMEFDYKVQKKFEEIFSQLYRDLIQSNDKSIWNFFDDKLPDAKIKKFFGLLKKVSNYKNDLADKNLKKVAGKNVGKYLKQYAYIEYTQNIIIECINLDDNSACETYEQQETIRFWKKFNEETERLEDQIPERKKLKGFGILNINKYDIVNISFNINRTTGVQELVKKGLEELENMETMEKAGGAQWGKLGAEGGAFFDKAVLKFLNDNFVSESDLSHQKFAYTFHQLNINQEIIGHLTKNKSAILKTGDLKYDLSEDVKEMPLVSFIYKQSE